MEQVDVGFDRAEKASTKVHGRGIARFLIHCNGCNAVAVRSTIARMQQRGYTFITLAEAMQ